MSHFTVLVIGNNPEEQLAPFQENNMGDCPREYMEFDDMTEELQKDYAEEDEKTKSEYPTFDQYASEYHGYKKDREKGVYGRWHNPNSKWDWYVLGGRWNGYFKTKLGVAAIVGEPGLMTPPAKDGYADQLTKDEIDFEFMRNEAANNASQKYDLAVKIFGNLQPNETWEAVREANKNNIEQARDIYWNQDRCVAWRKYEKENFKTTPFGWGSSPDEFLITKDEYLQNARDGAVSTFAVVKDGKWYERGQMGWWAFVTDEKDKDSWNKEFAKLIDEIPGDTLLSVFDCHI